MLKDVFRQKENEIDQKLGSTFKKGRLLEKE
jgi:hypothetical protein